MSVDEFRSRLDARTVRCGVALSREQTDQLAAYYQLLLTWNRRINLTALPLAPLQDATIDRLFVEPLAAAVQVSYDLPVRWFDLGSGGGSPAIPLQVARPLALLTMVEARERKCAFLREAVRELGLSQATVLTSRFETVPGAEVADLVTVRAVRLDPSLFATAHRLLSAGGRLLVFGASRPRPSPAPFHAMEGITLLPNQSSELLSLQK